jgi:hypothetical protein
MELDVTFSGLFCNRKAFNLVTFLVTSVVWCLMCDEHEQKRRCADWQ